MKVLLDTNAFLWQVGSPSGSKLGPQAKQTLLDASAVYVSAVTIAELHIKTMLGRLNAPVDCCQMVLDSGDELLSWSPAAADAIRALPQLSKHDPFDRFLLAQAQTDGMLFLTSDTTLLDLGLDFVQDARA